MDLMSIIDTIFVVNGISPEAGAVILLGFCSVLMGMQDWRISLISFFIGSALEYIIFYFLTWDMQLITYMLFVSIILMAFAIFSVRNQGQLA